MGIRLTWWIIISARGERCVKQASLCLSMVSLQWQKVEAYNYKRFKVCLFSSAIFSDKKLVRPWLYQLHHCCWPWYIFYRWFCIERFSWLENWPAYAWDCVLGSYVSVLRYLVPFWFYRLFCRYRKASKSKIIHNFTPTQQNQKPMRTILATKQLIRLAKFEILESIPGKMRGKK